MKVVHLNASDKGGASIVAQRLNLALNEYTQVNSQHLIFEGSTANLTYTQYWGNSPVRRIRAKLNHALDKFDFLQYEKEAKIRFQFNHARMGVDISEHPLIQQADIIHIHWILKGFLSFDSLLKLLALDKPVVWTCHDLWPFTGGCFYLWGCERLPFGCGLCPYLRNNEPVDLSYISLRKKIELFSSANIHWASPSKWLTEIALKSPVLTPQTAFSVIPNPIRINDFTIVDAVSKEQFKSQLQLNPKALTLLFSAANLENPAKGFVDFLQLVEALKEYDIQAIVVGATKENIMLPIPFYYAGYVRDPKVVRELFAAADIYVTTSHEDNLPTTVMESLACGVPAIGYEIGGVPELISNGVTGFVYPKGDWQSMVEGVMQLMEDPSLLKKFSFNARKKAEEQYDESHVAKQYAALYQNIVDTL
mgnify:CR=1 FL=1